MGLGVFPFGRGLFVLFLILAQATLAAPFYRLLYADDPLLQKFGKAYLERAYGAPIFVVKDGDELKKVAGIVFHIDAEDDPELLVGDVNPILEFEKLSENIKNYYPDVLDVGDKWDEALFLQHVDPEIAAPPTKLVNSYSTDLPQNERTAIETEVAAKIDTFSEALSKTTIDRARLLQKMVSLEIYRRKIESDLGKAILKVRVSSHTEGKLPNTSKDWVSTYLRYRLNTKPKILETRRRLRGTNESLQYHIVDFDDMEGVVLESILKHPDSVVAQKMLNIDKEVRVHVVEGKILEGATFLRNYPKGQYLKAEETKAVEGAVQRFLDRLPPELRKFSMGCDIVIEKNTGKMSIIDLNAGLGSGYFFAEEDVFTTSLLSKFYIGESTPALRALEVIRSLPAGAERSAKVKELADWVIPLLHEDAHESLWIRIFDVYRNDLEKSPSQEVSRAALETFWNAGLRDADLYLQFVSFARDTLGEEPQIPPEVGRIIKRETDPLVAVVRRCVGSH